jgi:formiminotetrahydrofolate cyclodeaminase
MSASLASFPFADLLDQLGSKTPAPGGGAAACATGALAAALAQMVVAYSLGKKSLAAHQDALQRASGALANARAVFLELADEDAAAYSLVNELSRLPESDPRRARELPEALHASILIPQSAIAAAADLLRLFESLAPITNPHLHSDLAIAAVLADAAARASLWNVRVNAAMLPDETSRAKPVAEAQSAAADASRRREAVERACSH